MDTAVRGVHGGVHDGVLSLAAAVERLLLADVREASEAERREAALEVQRQACRLEAARRRLLGGAGAGAHRVVSPRTR